MIALGRESSGRKKRRVHCKMHEIYHVFVFSTLEKPLDVQATSPTSWSLLPLRFYCIRPNSSFHGARGGGRILEEL